MQKLTLTIFFFLFTLTAQAQVAHQVNLSSYYPPPAAAFDRLRLLPKTIDALGTDCTDSGPGTIYYDNVANTLFLCGNDNNWKIPPGIWSQNGDNIYLTDTDSLLDRDGNGTLDYLEAKVAIGWRANMFGLTNMLRFSIRKDGGILSTGILGNGRNLNNPSGLGADSYFIWYPREAALRAGYVNGTQWDDANIQNHSFAFGQNNLNAGARSFIRGGAANTIALGADDSVIGGGQNNSATQAFTTIIGGDNNTSASLSSFIGGGQNNTLSPASGSPAANQNQAIGGGSGNKIHFLNSIILGGIGNEIWSTTGSWLSRGEFIGGGLQNKIGTNTAKDYNTLIGGTLNQIDFGAGWAAIGGGNQNTTWSDYSVIVGGEKNRIFGNSLYGTIAGGSENSITNSNYSVIGGGRLNDINTTAGNSSHWSAIMGGANCTVRANLPYNFIGGGGPNQTNGQASVIMGGGNNLATANGAFVGGGERNTASGVCSVAAGNNSLASADSSLTMGTIFSADQNAFLINFPVGVGTANPTAMLHINATGLAIGLKVEAGVVVIQNVPTEGGQDLYLGAANDVGFLDLAESFETSENVEAGDLLVMDQQQSGKLKKSTTPYDRKIAGVVSGAPAMLFEGSRMILSPKPSDLTDPTKPPVALKGRVMVKVSLENGPIKPGDVLTSSSIPGHAMKSSDPLKEDGAIIGKALAGFNGKPKKENTGMIPVFIALQ